MARKRKYVHDNPEYVALGKRCDHLKETLLNHGKYFSERLLRAVQREYRSVSEEFDELCDRLGEEGWHVVVGSAPTSPVDQQIQLLQRALTDLKIARSRELEQQKKNG